MSQKDFAHKVLPIFRKWYWLKIVSRREKSQILRRFDALKLSSKKTVPQTTRGATVLVKYNIEYSKVPLSPQSKIFRHRFSRIVIFSITCYNVLEVTTLTFKIANVLLWIKCGLCFIRNKQFLNNIECWNHKQLWGFKSLLNKVNEIIQKQPVRDDLQKTVFFENRYCAKKGFSTK